MYCEFCCGLKVSLKGGFIKMWYKEGLELYLAEQRKFMEDAERRYKLEFVDLLEDMRDRVKNKGIKDLSSWYLDYYKKKLGYVNEYRLSISKVELVEKLLEKSYTGEYLERQAKELRLMKMDYLESLGEREVEFLDGLLLEVEGSGLLVDINTFDVILGKELESMCARYFIAELDMKLSVIEDYLSIMRDSDGLED